MLSYLNASATKGWARSGLEKDLKFLFGDDAPTTDYAAEAIKRSLQ